MAKNLKQYFPLVWERNEILSEIGRKKELEEKFDSWTAEQQEEFLNRCTGVKGHKMLRDSFFKELMNPDRHADRMNDFLSCMLGQKVKVLHELPADSTRIADESSLVIMDIVVQLEDGSIANLEMQRVGYLFPGQRSACYSADLLLRQYKRVRSEKKKKFSYLDIKNVYTIVLFEKSPKEFKNFPDVWYHYFEQSSDTGIRLELLQKYLFIPLDIFRKSQHNKEEDRRDAWLTFFSEDDPEHLAGFIEKHPEFREMYDEAYMICRNIEEVMDMFSEELYELDKNTVQYMIDEMQDTIDEQKETIDEQKDIIDKQNQVLNQTNQTLNRSIRKIIMLQRKNQLPEEEIRREIMEEYHLTEEEVKRYFE